MWKDIRVVSLMVLLALIQGAAAQGTFDPLADPALIGWWRCDEGDGELVADSSPNGNDGTFVNGDPAWTEGAFGSAIQLVGPTLVEVPPMNLTLTEATMAGWVLPNGAQPDWASFIMHRGPGPAQGFNMLADRRLAYHWNDDSASWSYRGNAYYAADEWTHCAVTVEPSKATFYVNGIAASVNSIAHGPATWDGPVWLGGDGTSGFVGRRMNGALDDVLFMSRALTAQEIRAIVPLRVKASKPDPADGTLNVAVPLLRWTKGETALFHNVYLGMTPELTEANLAGARLPMTLYYHAPGLTPGMMYYWRVDEIEVDGATIHTGDVWRFVTQDVTAYYPAPVDGSNTAAVAPTLTWMPGQGAVKHQVYFSSDRAAVVQGAAEADQGVLDLADASFAPGTLDSLTTYYWRVDETVAGGAVQTGPVWSFTTVLPVDDIESYTDDEGSRIYETWIDGFTNGNSGSTVGYFDAPFAEQTIVHGGLQSMPMDYNNVETPFFSEAEQEFLTAQDWTVSGADTLMLYVRGRSRNAEAPLYVGLEDAAGQSAVVVHSDPAAVQATKWLEWTIPLSEFAGVNAARVKKIYVGVGDKADPQAGGTGRIYVDDIQVTKPAPAPEP